MTAIGASSRAYSGARGVPVSEIPMIRKRFFLAVLFILLLAFVAGALAQDSSPAQTKPKDQPPAAAPAESPDGVPYGGYNVHMSLELGGHIVNGHGSPETYDTFVNLHSGPRILEQSLEMHSTTGGIGQLFDTLYMNSFGYGGDPLGATRVRVSKRKFYEFTGMFRRDQNFWDYNLFANPYNPPPPPASFGGAYPLMPAPFNVYTSPPYTNLAGNWNPNPFVDQSLHKMELVRRLTDLGVTLAPQSVVSLRLGYSANTMEGPSFTTYHEGVDARFFQPWQMHTNTLRLGADYKGLTRTRISFDQIIDWYDQNTAALNTDLNFQTNFRGVTTPLNPGVNWDWGVFPMPPPPAPPRAWQSGAPCNNPITNTATTLPTITPTCNGYVSYVRTEPFRGMFPTSQLNIRSNYFKNVDFNLRGGYSSVSLRVPNFSEVAAGLVSRTAEQAFSFTGPVHNSRVNANLEGGVTVHLADNIRLSDTFFWNAWRSPGAWNSAESIIYANPSSMATVPNIYDPATCTPTTLAACPVHVAGNGADLSFTDYLTFHKLDTKMNLIELQFDASRRFGFRAGYRYRHRDYVDTVSTLTTEVFFPGPTLALASRGDCAAGTVNPATGVCTVTLPPSIEDPDSGDTHIPVAENSFVAGAWARPTDALRFEFDAEYTSADAPFNRLAPRTSQEYRIRANYKPQSWFQFGASADLIKMNNNTAGEVGHDEHSRTFGFNATFVNKEWLTLDFAYDYNDFASNTNTCFLWYEGAVSATPTPTAVVDNTFCGGPAGSFNYWRDNSYYLNRTHSGNFDLILKPVKRVTAMLGYTLTSSAANTNGTTLPLPVFGDSSSSTATQATQGLNPWAPVGQLGMNYHMPNAMLMVDVARHVALKAGWNYYDYNEKFPAGFTAPRDFAANVTTLSLRYSF